jgi:hypothetical protein
MEKEDSSIKRLKTLVKFLKIHTGLTSEELAARAGYNEGYISQCYSRGKVPEKFILALSREFSQYMNNEDIAEPKEIAISKTFEEMAIDILQLKAIVTTLSERLAMAEAIRTGRQAADVLEEMNQSTSLRLKALKGKPS